MALYYDTALLGDYQHLQEEMGSTIYVEESFKRLVITCQKTASSCYKQQYEYKHYLMNHTVFSM